jgi:O-antigen ligase
MINQLIIILSVVLITDYALKNNSKNFITACAIFFTAYIFINFASIILYPDGLYIVDDVKSYWFLGHKNSYVKYMIIAILFNFLRIRFENKKVDLSIIALLIISFVSVLLVDSSTSIIGLSIISLYFIIPWFFNKFSKSAYKIYVIITCILCFLILILGVQNNFSYIIENVFDRDASFTGRTIIWKANMEDISKQPILGHGIESVDLRIERAWYVEAVNAHNLYLEILYQGGLLLFISFIAIIIKTGIEIKKCKKNEAVSFVSLVVGTMLMMAIVESYPIYMIFMLLIIAMNIKHIYKDEIQCVEEKK